MKTVYIRQNQLEWRTYVHKMRVADECSYEEAKKLLKEGAPHECYEDSDVLPSSTGHEQWQFHEGMIEEKCEQIHLSKELRYLSEWHFQEHQPALNKEEFYTLEERVNDPFYDQGICSRVPLSTRERESIQKAFDKKGTELIRDNKYVYFFAPAMFGELLIPDKADVELVIMAVGAFKAFFPKIKLQNK